MIKLIGVPYDLNSSFMQGSAMAPVFIRLMDTEGSANQFCERGKQINHEIIDDLGDLPITRLGPIEAYHSIKTSVEEFIKDSDKLISLGGDHSVSFPIIEAHAEKYQGLNVLHIDAHADLYENFEDNPYSHASPFARLLEKGILKSLTQVGIRTLNDHQRDQAKKYGVKVVEMKDFNLDFLSLLEGPLYVSLDLDGLDPAYAPGVSHHEPGGLSTRQVIDMIHEINVSVIGADIVELNPKRDLNNMTAMVAYKLFKELVSKMME